MKKKKALAFLLVLTLVVGQLLGSYGISAQAALSEGEGDGGEVSWVCSVENCGGLATLVQAKEPACEEEGNIAYYTCATHGGYYEDETYSVALNEADVMIAATGHTEVIDPAEDPNCTETGLTEGSHCDVCGDIIIAQQVVDANGHTETQVPSVPAGCTEPGMEAYYTCTVCGGFYSDEDLTVPVEEDSLVIPATGHSYDEDNWTTDLLYHWHAATCGHNDMEVIKADAQNSLWAAHADTNADNACDTCGAEMHTTCVYDQEVATEEYLKTPATCTDVAVYYKSCECGAKGGEEDTFESGEVIPHTFDQEVATEDYLKSEATCTHKAVYYKSCTCGEKGGETDTFESGEVIPHTFDQEVATEDYLKSEATCTDVAVYYKSCTCGEKGGEEDTFESGEVKPHVHNQEVVADKYLKSEATCTAKAVYYKSCVCGLIGTETFEAGELKPHVCDKEVVNAKYLKSAATCTAKAVYFKSCECGAKGTATFTYGQLAAHTVVKDAAVAPTCDKTGLTEGSHCSKCNAVITKQNVVAAKGHTYVTTTTKATTKANGAVLTQCTTCKHVASNTAIAYPKTVKLSKTIYTYTGKKQKKLPTLTVKDSAGKTIAKSNYTVTGLTKKNKAVGNYTVTVKFKGNYSGTVKLTYSIAPKGTSISKLTASKKGFTVKWKKQKSQTSGYEIQYSTDKNFKKAKTKVVTKNGTTSVKITKLSAKKKYYVRIRTYKTVKGKKVYSEWSKVKNVKTKK